MSTLLRILAWVLALALVALPVVAVLNGWVGAERWPLSRLQVSGDFKRVPAEQLRQVVLPYARRGFFAVRLQDAQDAIERLPWVESARVRKRWPDVLEVRVTEHRPFARWGADRMLSEQGRIFALPSELRGMALPQLAGPDAKAQDVVALYNESRALFAPAGLPVNGVAMDARGSWSLQLGEDVQIVVGRDDARTRLARFARVLPQLVTPEQAPIARADLRYTNGFTVERRGSEIRDSGSGKKPASQRSASVDLPRIPSQPAFTNLKSRISNPGSKT
ncbi:cell division protein FtsQ/DivIB [Xanthomonas sp. NCPPB 2654]|uniref:cell division protein FtsQ/DivIB n=1 Tax=unclassified Xanthomonas TaxID=2643310 RepID=UPI0021DF56F0|nr:MULTISPECIES: cell division protein FtsQ/DivIB [unclassified Xanthomonas]MDL5365180.1 cell division protein FtsQ/DivIB [Xanthomonas sp. NCPPB 2654]UYC21599.1 cell division protein FtsQ/DivIB [Xanthomonas sp. CFBP 8443]